MDDDDDSRIDTDALLLTAAVVARLLAISERSVWRLTSMGKIPAPVRVGGSTRWRLADVRAFLDDMSRAGAGRHP